MSEAAWKSINSQQDASDLLTLFGGFHDSCLREAHVWTEHYVSNDLSMNCPGHLDTRVSILIQRQFKSPSAIELLFEQVTAFHLQPTPNNYDSVILEATLLSEGDQFWWADSEVWSPKSASRDKSTWISSRKLSWRDASDWMGSKLRYVAENLAV